MMIKISKEPKGMGPPMERCYFCGKVLLLRQSDSLVDAHREEGDRGRRPCCKECARNREPEEVPTRPPFTIHLCACGKPCEWCKMREDIRVSGRPFILGRGMKKEPVTACDMKPHLCGDCFVTNALKRHAEGDPEVFIHSSPTQRKK